MKINTSFFDDIIEWDEGSSIAYLTIENHQLFRELIAYLNNPLETDYSYFKVIKEEKKFDFKNILVITDIFNVDKSFKIQSIIEKEVQRLVLQEYYEDFLSFQNSWSELGWLISSKLDYDLVPNDEISIGSFVKKFKFHLDKDELSSLEFFVEYIKIVRDLGNIKLVIIPNITGLLRRNELKYLIGESILYGIPLLLIESSQIDIQSDLVNHFIIDNDFCEI